MTLLWLALSTLASAEEPPVIDVLANPLARWDDTRWRVDMQLGVPFPAALYAERNSELQFVALDVRLVFHCDLDGEPVRGRIDVACVIEDTAVSAAPWGRKWPEQALQALQETDDGLTGLLFLLRVDDDGRVHDVGLSGEPQSNERVNTQYENLRQIVARALYGFHADLPTSMYDGAQAIEKNTRMMTLPSFRYSMSSMAFPLQAQTDMPEEIFISQDRNPYSSRQRTSGMGRVPTSAPATAGPPGRLKLEKPKWISMPRAPTTGAYGTSHTLEAITAPASVGRNTVLHQFDRYQGSYIVQSVGEGSADIGAAVSLLYRGKMTSVAVLSAERGFMTERRWTVSMSPTASSLASDGAAGWPFWQIGSLQLLGAQEESPVGPSVLLAPPHETRADLPPWPAL